MQHCILLYYIWCKANGATCFLKQSRKKKPETPSSKSAFHSTTADIATGIHRTTATLGELTKLIKRQGLFDDPSDKINNLIVRIKEDIGELNSQCDAAQSFVEDSKRQSAAKNQASSHNLNVVTSLKSELMNTTKTFKSALEMRSYKMKNQQEKKIQMAGNSTLSPMRQFKATQQNQSGAGAGGRGGGGRDGPFSQAPSPKNLGNTAMKSMIAASPYSASPYDNNSQGSTASNALPYQQQEGPQSSQMMLLAPPAEVQYYDQRQQAVTEVEKTIGELGTLFKRLSAMISEQAELVERIDDDIETAIEQSELAQGALLKTYEQVSSNRGMYTKLAAIGVLSGLFFVLFLM